MPKNLKCRGEEKKRDKGEKQQKGTERDRDRQTEKLRKPSPWNTIPLGQHSFQIYYAMKGIVRLQSLC